MNRWISPVWWHFFYIFIIQFWHKAWWVESKTGSGWFPPNHTFPGSTSIYWYNEILLICVFDVLGMCTFLMGKLGYKSVRIIRFLGVISIQRKSFCPVAQHQWVWKTGNLHVVLRDYSDLNFAGEFMLSGHPDYEPFTLLRICACPVSSMWYINELFGTLLGHFIIVNLQSAISS